MSAQHGMKLIIHATPAKTPHWGLVDAGCWSAIFQIMLPAVHLTSHLVFMQTIILMLTG